MSSLAEYERPLRPGMIHQTNQVWRMSEGRIASLVESLSGSLREAEAKSRLQESYSVLRKVIDSLVYDKAYSEEENPHYFKELIENLQDAFKYFYESFMIEENSTFGDDKIDQMNIQFYRSLARKRGLSPPDFVIQAYPPITLLIRLLRNCQKHERNRPTDHITGKRSFGNLYTISSIIILSIYGFSEVLQAWLNTNEIANSRRINE